MTAYDPTNIFAKMIAGSIPAVKVEETADYLAVMDIFPQARGQRLEALDHGSAGIRQNLREQLDGRVFAPGDGVLDCHRLTLLARQRRALLHQV